MFRDEFDTVEQYHAYIGFIEEYMYPDEWFILDPDTNTEEPDEDGLVYPEYLGWLHRSGTSRPMFEIETSHPYNPRNCLKCSADHHDPDMLKVYWDDIYHYWAQQPGVFGMKEQYDPAFTASEPHP
jgi:hypothetical protein